MLEPGYRSNLHGKQNSAADANNLLMIDQDLLHVHKLQHKLLKLQLQLQPLPSTLTSVIADPVLAMPSEMQVKCVR